MEKPSIPQENNWDSQSVEMYQSVDNIKKQMRKGNWTYIWRHPEIRAIIRVFLHELIDKQPKNIYEFSAALFNCNNTPLLITKVNKQLQIVNKELKKGQWSHHDCDMVFAESDSSHSLLSSSSVGPDIDSMLRYAVILRDKNMSKK
uniref:Uncharacterized protein n=1 Tax=Glossina pallidipes TaxID=7398 RepID=A0A1B0AA63_GLOPL